MATEKRKSRELERLNSEIEKHEERLRGLRARRARLRRRVAKAAKERRRLPSGELDPRAMAGAEATWAMQDAYEELRRCSQATAQRRAGIPVGRGTWASKALVLEGVIVPTGERVANSPVYRFVPPAERVTTLEPGS